MAEPVSDVEPSTLRVKPSIGIGIGVYAGYLAIFYATWAINGVDYPHIGETVESAKLHYVSLASCKGPGFRQVHGTTGGWC